jgi:hypothetical protein
MQSAAMHLGARNKQRLLTIPTMILERKSLQTQKSLPSVFNSDHREMFCSP